MSVSFQRAVSFMQETDAGRLLICLGDMPNISSSLLRSLLARSGDAACCFQGLRMPPALLTRHQLANAAGMGAGDHGARRLLKHIPDCALIELTPSQATDIDRIEDLSSPSFCDPALLRENE